MSRKWSFLLFAATALLSWYAYEKFAMWLDMRDPAFFATVLIGSMVLHELGHWALMETHGLKSHIFFAVILGGAMPEDPRKYMRLSWSKRAAITLAGPAGNLTAVVLAAALHLGGLLSADQLSRVANINGALMSFNMLPFGPLDGGHFMKLLFDSAPEQKDRLYRGAIIAACSLIILWTGLVSGNYYVATAGLIVVGTRKYAEHDDPHGSTYSCAMNRTQCRISALIYVVLIGFGVLLEAISLRWSA
jgi:Zn-dependent protease